VGKLTWEFSRREPLNPFADTVCAIKDFAKDCVTYATERLIQVYEMHPAYSRGHLNRRVLEGFELRRNSLTATLFWAAENG
jgi:hypothetical protein